MPLPKLTQKKTVANSRLFEIEQLDLEFSNSEKRTYERLISKGHGAVLIIALTSDYVFLIREYCGGTERYELGFPKGRVDANETILAAANRELQEEVGVGANSLKRIKKIALLPGYFKSGIEVIIAQDLYPASLLGDEPEPLEVIKWPISELDSLIARDDFAESYSIAALFLLKQYLIDAC